MTVHNITTLDNNAQELLRDLYENGYSASHMLGFFKNKREVEDYIEEYGALAVTQVVQWLTEVQEFTELNSCREFRLGRNIKYLRKLAYEELGAYLESIITRAAYYGDDVYNAVDLLIERIAEVNPDAEFDELPHRPLMH